MTTEQFNQFLNLVYFLVGLAVGLGQLYLSQRQFQAQQRERMDELRNNLAQIQERLAVLQETNSQRTYDVQDKLINLVVTTKETLLQTQVAQEIRKAE